MRTRNTPPYLKNYILNLDLRKVKTEKRQIAISCVKIEKNDYQPDFSELKGYLIHLIRLKMDHSVLNTSV